MPVASYSNQSSVNSIGLTEENTSMEDEFYLSEDYSSYDKPEKYERYVECYQIKYIFIISNH